MSKLVPIPLPLLGLNTINPNIEPESGYAREFTNLALSSGRVITRPACKLKYSNNLTPDLDIFWFDDSSGIAFFIQRSASPGTVRFATSGAIDSVLTTTTVNALATRVKHASLDLVIGMGEPKLAAYPFTDWSMTTQVVNDDEITSACNHKGRIYVSDGETVEYSDIGQTSGSFETDGVAGGNFVPTDLLDGQTILRQFSVTIQQGNESDNVYVIFGSDGKVLVYSGDFPDSDDWRLIGKYDMPRPASGAGFYEIDGDIIVCTPRYAYWFRDLFSEGAVSAYKNRITKPIENLWQSLTWSASGALASHVFYLDNIRDVNDSNFQNLDALVFNAISTGDPEEFNLNDIADYNNPSVYFVYFRKYDAWALWLMDYFNYPARIGREGDVLACGEGSDIKRLYSCNYVDEHSSFIDSSTVEIEVETSWKTPYFSPFSGRVQKLCAVRPYFFNSSSGYLHRVRSIFNFSDYNAPYGFHTQSTVTAINPGIKGDHKIDIAANAYNNYTQIADPGGIGGGFSLQFSLDRKAGSNASQRQELYAAIALVEDGGVFL